MTELDHTREFRFLTRAGWGDAMCHLFQYDELNARKIGLIQEVVTPRTQIEQS